MEELETVEKTTIESPNEIYGRLKEALHFTGYGFARTCKELEWLLDENRWKETGPGFEDINEFLETIKLADFKFGIDQRKKLAKKLADLQATQRATAKALGVTHTTVQRDVGTNVPRAESDSAELQEKLEESGTNVPTPPTSITIGGQEAQAILQRKIETEQSKKDRAEEIKKEREALAETGKNIESMERFCVECADITTWQAPRKYDFIITDPPYKKEFLHLYSILAHRAKEWLKPGGLLIAMCGQSYLNEIYKRMDEHLTYYWTASYLTPGQPKPMRQVNVNTTWKPLLIYRQDKYAGPIFGDVMKSDGNDKTKHEWGQSESGMIDIISHFCLPGQYVLDPFLGAGTTGVAAIKNGCFFDGIDIDIENVNIAKTRLYDQNREG